MLLSYVPVCFAATPSLREDIHIGFPKGGLA